MDEQLIMQLTRIEDKLGEGALKQGHLTFKKPERPSDMSDERYEAWVKECELRAWFNSLTDDQRKYLNNHMHMRIMTVFNQKIGPLTKEETLLLQDHF